MRVDKNKILSFILLLVFTIPILVMGIHDNFQHQHSQNHNENSNISFDIDEGSLCLIHNFKYYLFDSYKIDINTKPFHIKNGFTPKVSNLFLKENIISFYLLRGPPFINM